MARWFASAILIIASFAFGHAQSDQSCKCTVNQSCWPSSSQWAQLSANLTYPVFAVRPPGYYCHDPTYNAVLCASAQAGAYDALWRANQPGAEEADNWEFTPTSQCFIFGNRTEPCGQGRVPALGINATSVSDIQHGVQFAFTYNLKLHVKNTGHDFLGRGIGPGSLVIWTHNFRFLEFAAEYQYSTGQNSGTPAITVGPGIQWVDAYDFAAQNQVVIAGGIGPEASVGAGGGWPLGGGHNIISPLLGLGADNVLELTVVLPNGTRATANQYLNTDLFWALRGGGGPSFGIATSITYAAHPEVPLYASFFEAYTNSTTAFVSLLDTFHAALPSLGDAGWSGYYPFENASYFALMYLLPNGTTETGNATLGVWIQQAAAIPGVTIATDATTTYANFQDWLVANILEPAHVVGFNYTGGRSVGIGINTASWLIPRTVFEDPTDAHNMSVAVAAIPAGIGQHVAGGVVAQKSKDFDAVHPAWRDALVDITIFGTWADGASQTEISTIRTEVTDLMAPLRALTPVDGGQYLNEPDLLIPDFPHMNWGYHYDRLAAIKKAVDPTNLLLVVQGVGSENWDSEQICPL